jgi:Asp-tRNA(Asn)/Glu-tRNA(Gln) amidotransferase A subunit family amidase
VAEIAPDIFFASISELNAKLRAKEFSCVELTRAFCDRLERIGPRYNALALSLREQAVRAARDVDRDYILEPDQALQYGMIDHIIESRSLQPVTK